MPASSTVSVVVRPPTRASRQTMATAQSAPANAASGPRKAGPPSATASTEPKAAPADVPVTNGSASGFRSRPWSSAPATASAPPTSAAASTRGARRSRTIAAVAPSPPPASAARTSAGAIGTAPTRLPAAALATTAATSAASATTGFTASGTCPGAAAARTPRPPRRRVVRTAHQVRGDRQHALVAHRADARPGRPSRDLLGRDAVVRVSQHDDLGIRRTSSSAENCGYGVAARAATFTPPASSMRSCTNEPGPTVKGFAGSVASSSWKTRGFAGICAARSFTDASLRAMSSARRCPSARTAAPSRIAVRGTSARPCGSTTRTGTPPRRAPRPCRRRT